MTQIRNKFDIRNQIEQEAIKPLKKLPNFFDENDELKPATSFMCSVGFHIVFVLLLCLLGAVQEIIAENLPKPKTPPQDIEFKLVRNQSKTPINKKTKIRADRNTRAGGKHDPKRAISEPSPTPAKKPVKQVQKQAPAKKTVKTVSTPNPIQKIMQKNTPKPVAKQVPTPSVAQPVSPQKPKAVSAPTAKPALKPAIKPQGVSVPTAPKTTTAPKSPFVVNTPKSTAPVGPTYRPKGEGTYGGSSNSHGNSAGAPAPKLASSGYGGTSGASKGQAGNPSGGSKYAPRGAYGGGYGTGGNPGPGNPNGTPGIDAIRQPNWGPYMRDLEQRIKRNWSPPKGDTSKRVVITFTISRDGRLLSKRLVKSSGVALADQAAMSAIELTAPFRPLPPEFKGQSVPIEFTFDYNVFNGSVR